MEPLKIDLQKKGFVAITLCKNCDLIVSATRWQKTGDGYRMLAEAYDDAEKYELKITENYHGSLEIEHWCNCKK